MDENAQSNLVRHDQPNNSSQEGSRHSHAPSSRTRPQPRTQINRARIACRRCRRLRVKCLHDDGQTPCFGCQKAGPGVAQECTFPPPGVSSSDRVYRAKAPRENGETRTQRSSAPFENTQPSIVDTARESPSPSSPTLPAVHKVTTDQDRWELLPPSDEVIEACKVLYAHFFQLGFLPKAVFIERLTNNPQSIDLFFLSSILSVSARFTPSLIRRYGHGLKAAEVFMDLAVALVPEEMYSPTLERTQAFFLLAIAEWGKGDKISSNIHMGIAVRMAGMLRLHREETYQLAEGATAEEVINSEVARRTFWMLESQDNLHSGYTSPVSFSLSDITTLLPCDESDFSFGNNPTDRAALAGTAIATRNPDLVNRTSRSLFATLIQAHNLWGQIARRAVSNDYGSSPFEPWESRSEYALLLDALSQWEELLPARHRWSIWNLRGFKNEGLDLAYLSTTMVVRLSNIVLRRNFLERIIYATGNDGSPDMFWKKMSIELFQNVLSLKEQIEAFFFLRSKDQGYPAMIVFCVYICGSLGNHLWKHPELCADFASHAEGIVSKSLEVLVDLQHAWPLARRWRQALQRTAKTIQQGLFATPSDTTSLDYPMYTAERTSNSVKIPDNSREVMVQEPPLNHHEDHTSIDAPAGIASQMPQHNGFSLAPTSQLFFAYNYQANPGDGFDTELTAFLEAEGQLGFLYEWNE